MSGNVSLYNETNGRAILPTPTIGGVGVLNDFMKSMSLGFKADGQVILLIGISQGWLGQSLYLRDICGREEGAPPPVDLVSEKRNGAFIRNLIEAGKVTAAHDISDGGLAVALAEMAIMSGIGATLDNGPSNIPPHAYWFGEDQARYVVTTADADGSSLTQRAAGVPVAKIGVTGGNALALPGESPVLITALNEKFEGWLPAYMAGAAT